MLKAMTPAQTKDLMTAWAQRCILDGSTPVGVLVVNPRLQSAGFLHSQFLMANLVPGAKRVLGEALIDAIRKTFLEEPAASGAST